MSIDQVGGEALDAGADSADVGSEQENLSSGAAVGGEQAQPNVSPDAIVVGNERFDNIEAFKKSYLDFRKGFTQKSQSWAAEKKKWEEEKKLYSATSEIVKKLRNNPEAFAAFQALLAGGVSPNQAARQAVQETAPDTQRREASPSDPRVDQLLERVERQEIQRSFESFVNKHPYLSPEEVRQVLMRTMELEDNGVTRSFEEVYRNEFFELAAAKFYSKGQKEAAESAKKSRQGGTLGSVAPTAPPPKKQKRFLELESSEEQDEYIRKMLRDAGPKS
jgi:hypothetical protein